MLDAPGGATEPLGRAVEVAPQITALVQLIEQVEGDHPVGLIGQVGADLLDQMLAQGAWSRRGLVDPGHIAKPARAVSAVPRLESAAEIATHLDRAVAIRPGGGAPVIGRLGNPIAGEHFGKRCGRAVDCRGVGVRLEAGRRVVVAALATLEQRVLLDFGLDKIAELDIGQLQHLDRLLQLRRHHQSLALAQFKPLRKADPVHQKPRPERPIG